MGIFSFSNRPADAPAEILNFRLWYSVAVFGFMGAARGLDEGLIGTTATLPSFSRLFDLQDPSKTAEEQANLLSNITSMVQLGSIAGALVGFYLADKLGRLWTARTLCVIWSFGIALFLSSAADGDLGRLYAGRFIAGIGVGMTTVVAPTYLAEVSPRFTRGLSVCIFSGSVYLGIMLGYFAAYGSKLHLSDNSSIQWVNPNLLHIYFSAIIFIGSFFAVESPRWLMKVGKNQQALAELSKLRHLPEDHPFVQAEIVDISYQLERESEATRGTTWMGPVRELLCQASNRYRLMLSVGTQVLSQWSGASSITIYAVEYFALVGVKGSEQKLLATAVFGIIKFSSAIACAFFIIDALGRKRALTIGIALQFVSMLYIAIQVQVADPDDQDQTANAKRAATASIVMIYVSGIGWALGWNSVQYLINSEIYPLRIRAIGGSFAMTFHFLNQYANTKAVPSMFIGLTHAGTMFFFAAVTLLGLAFVWLCIPELAGKSLEAIDAVFELPWWQIGRKGGQLANELTVPWEDTNAEKAGMAVVTEHKEEASSKA